MLEEKSNTEKGKTAEEIAENFITEKGMKIIARNFHFGRAGEIDLIAKDGNTIVFFEVKARWSSRYGKPEESVSWAKTQKLRKAAEGFMYIRKLNNFDCRFDFIGIEFINSKPIINHIVNAF